MVSRTRFACGLILTLCLLPALACGPRKGAPAGPPPAVRDEMVLAVDGLAPANGMDGKGSLFLGDGWGRPEGSGDGSDWGSMSWVIGQEATVHLFVPSGERMDFFARCLPFPWHADAPIQTLELFAGERPVGRVELARDWQNVRIPLPDDLPGNRLLTLRLRFDHALAPGDLGLGDDLRSLAAAFSQVALVPRAVADPVPFLAAQSFDPETGRVVLPAGGGLRLPVPPASQVRLRVSILSPCRDCRLSLELSGPGATTRVLQTSPREAAEGTVSAGFSTDPRGPQNLWLRVSSPRCGAPLETLTLALDEVAVDARLAPAGAPPHVFLYMIDTLRADVLGPYGGPPGLTPHLDAFAREAVTYRRARATSTWTLPSVASLLTGLYPDRHGVMSGFVQLDVRRTPLLQHLLRARGYRTVGISQSFIVSPAYGLSQGFQTFHINDQLNGMQLRSQEARAFLASWLGQNGGGSPIFAYVHTVDPHAPYIPRSAPGPELAKLLEEGSPGILVARGKGEDRAAVARLRELYEEEVRYTDRELGRFVELLKWLGLYEQSVVIVVGDHGEELADHGGFEHGRTLYEETLRVPLLVKYPRGRGAGGSVDEPVSLVDVLPTVLREIGGVPAGSFDGRPLPLPGDPRRPRTAFYFEVALYREPGAAPVDLRGLVVEDLKCVHNRAGVDRFGRPAPPFQSFDLAADPAERRPLAAEAGETLRCQQLLESWQRARERQVRMQRSRLRTSSETVAKLRALGYFH